MIQGTTAADKPNVSSEVIGGLISELEEMIDGDAKSLKDPTIVDSEDIVQEEDVDIAFKFIKEKLTFLSTLEDLKVPDFKKGQKPGPDERAKLLKDKFKGKDVTIEEAKTFIEEKAGYEFSDKNIKRDLEKIGKPVKAKIFNIF